MNERCKRFLTLYQFNFSLRTCVLRSPYFCERGHAEVSDNGKHVSELLAEIQQYERGKLLSHLDKLKNCLQKNVYVELNKLTISL